MSNELVHRQAEDFLPVLTAEQVVARYNTVVQLYTQVMKVNQDYGVIPGTGDKPTLLKPGAEKLCTLFGLCVEDPEIVTEVEDWTGKDHGGEPFFLYKIRQRLTRNGRVVASQIGSANSWESKYRYRWVPEQDVPPELDTAKLRKRGGKVSEFTFAVDKAETGGQYGKPAEYWQRFKDAIENRTARKIKKKTSKGKEYDAWEIESVLFRVPNTEAADSANTLIKMAQKRALLSAVLLATNCSEFFTTDQEEIVQRPEVVTDEHGEIIDAEYAPAKQNGPAEKPADLRETALALLKTAASDGTKTLMLAWDALTKSMRESVAEGRACPAKFKEQAAAADKAKAAVKDSGRVGAEQLSALYAALRKPGARPWCEIEAGAKIPPGTDSKDLTTEQYARAMDILHAAEESQEEAPEYA